MLRSASRHDDDILGSTLNHPQGDRPTNTSNIAGNDVRAALIKLDGTNSGNDLVEY